MFTNIYGLTKTFPKDEVYGLISQMRRAAVSYPCNISEEAARSSTKEYIHFTYIALGSLSELETQIIIAKNLVYIYDIEEILNQIELLRKMTLSFMKFLKKKNK
jgi:four helix bundle protein